MNWKAFILEICQTFGCEQQGCVVFSLGAAPISYQPSLVGKNFSFSWAGLAAKPAALLLEGGS